jgi:hypothetical protein
MSQRWVVRAVRMIRRTMMTALARARWAPMTLVRRSVQTDPPRHVRRLHARKHALARVGDPTTEVSGLAGAAHDCHFESICEAFTFFVTAIEFRPTLERQRDDAEAKGQKTRQQIYDGLLSRLDQSAS